MTTNNDIEQFRRSARQVVRELGFFRSEYQGTGVTSAQAHILLELGERPPLSLNNLIENVRMDKSSASRTVKRLVEMKLVRSKDHHGDQRLKLFELTSLGRRKLQEIDATSVETVQRALKCLTVDNRNVVCDGMRLYGKALREARLRRDYEIRAIRPSDDEALGALIKAILWNEFQESEDEVTQMLPEIDSLSGFYGASGSQYFVVVEGSKVRGGAGLAPLSGGDPRTCEIQKMYLSPSVRSKGLGGLLLETCLNFARKAGYLNCYLDTRANMTAARQLYERHGFRQVQKPLGETGHVICDCFYLRSLE